MANINQHDGVLVTPEMLREMVDYIRQYEDIIGQEEKFYVSEIFRRIGYTDLLFSEGIPKNQHEDDEECKNWLIEQEQLSVIYERLADDGYVFDYQYYAHPCRVLEITKKFTKVLVKIPFNDYQSDLEHIEPPAFVIIKAQPFKLIESSEDYQSYNRGYKSLERSAENPKLSLAFSWFANQSVYEQWSDYVRGCSLLRDEARGVFSRSKITEDSMAAHKALGLEPGVNADKVREAYRKLSAIHHPDRGGDHGRMSEINTAYDMLMS
jgi:hypothetical protein